MSDYQRRGNRRGFLNIRFNPPLSRWVRGLEQLIVDRLDEAGVAAFKAMKRSRILRNAVPRDTGALSRGWRYQYVKGRYLVKNIDPAAQYIRYKRAARYGARTPRQTLERWAKTDAQRIIRREIQRAFRRD